MKVVECPECGSTELVYTQEGNDEPMESIVAGYVCRNCNIVFYYFEEEKR